MITLRSVGLVLSGDTPDFEATFSGDRGDEIVAALREQSCGGRDCLPWVALDDMDLVAMNSRLCDASFVRTDDAVGLTRAKADEAVRKLQAQRELLSRPRGSGAPSLSEHPWVAPWAGTRERAGK